MNKIIGFLIITFMFLANDALARYCNSPSCRMCNRIFGPMPGYDYNGYPLAVKQDKLPPYMPILDNFYVGFESSPISVIRKALQIANPAEGEIVCDLGCGDARFLIEAMKSYNVAGLGIEKNSRTVKLAKRKIREAGFNKSITIVEGEISKYLVQADIVYLYLFPDDIKSIHSSLKNARMVISYCHDIPQLPTQKIQFLDGDKTHTFFIYLNKNEVK